MFVSDLRHFLDLPADVPGPARRMAEHLSLIVRAATAGDAGVAWVSALGCSRRPGRRPCQGHLAVFRTEVPPSIEWQCTSCGDDGVISGWERSQFDLRPRGNDPGPGGELRAVVPAEVAATLRTLTRLDGAGTRLVFRACASDDGAVLTGTREALADLVDRVAAEAADEHDRRRRRRINDTVRSLGATLAT
jgi:hypothetical protein